MKALWITFGVVAAVIVITVIAAISIRNGLIERDEQVRENWSQIETQLQRRTDLIPNLVNTVKGYAKQSGCAGIQRRHPQVPRFALRARARIQAGGVLPAARRKRRRRNAACGELLNRGRGLA